MGNKKVIMSVTASAVVASTMIGAVSADAASYKVQPGDTLWKISQKHGMSVSEVMLLNNLSTDAIKVGQVLNVEGKQVAEAKKPTKEKTVSTASTSSSASTYTVKSGDTLSKIARSHGISVKNLQNWNKLSSDVIYPNQVLKVAAGSGSTENNASATKPKQEESSPAPSGGATYTIKAGDTLSKIAHAHGISVKNLKDWNKLSGDVIYPNQVLKVAAGGDNAAATKPKQEESSPAPSGKATYTVKAGDTLSKIARAHGISLQNLMAWNNASSTIIYPGDTLVVSKNGAAPSKNASSEQNEKTPSKEVAPASGSLIEVAKSVIGTPYVWAGTTPSGFDCSGFIYWAFANSGNDVGRHSTDGYYNRSYIVNTPQVGDLVFFEGTYKSGISHMGIYLGGGEFIHAGTSTGVTVSSVNNSYWKKHFHSYKRFY